MTMDCSSKFFLNVLSLGILETGLAPSDPPVGPSFGPRAIIWACFLKNVGYKPNGFRQ